MGMAVACQEAATALKAGGAGRAGTGLRRVSVLIRPQAVMLVVTGPSLDPLVAGQSMSACFQGHILQTLWVTVESIEVGRKAGWWVTWHG